jgi:hypothetical protein
MPSRRPSPPPSRNPERALTKLILKFGHKSPEAAKVTKDSAMVYGVGNNISEIIP